MTCCCRSSSSRAGVVAVDGLVCLASSPEPDHRHAVLGQRAGLVPAMANSNHRGSERQWQQVTEGPFRRHTTSYDFPAWHCSQLHATTPGVTLVKPTIDYGVYSVFRIYDALLPPVTSFRLCSTVLLPLSPTCRLSSRMPWSRMHPGACKRQGGGQQGGGGREGGE